MERKNARRDVLNDARRRVERSLGSTEAADELARAAEELLASLDKLRTALERYRKLRGE